MCVSTYKNRKDYFYFNDISTRWMDNDVYGHINNVTYYSYFDSIVNKYLIEEGGLNINQDQVVGFVVASNCEYFAPLSYPEKLESALVVSHIGNSSVEYKIGIFKRDSADVSALGGFTHVFVSRETGKAVSIPIHLKNALSKIYSTKKM